MEFSDHGRVKAKNEGEFTGMNSRLSDFNTSEYFNFESTMICVMSTYTLSANFLSWRRIYISTGGTHVHTLLPPLFETKTAVFVGFLDPKLANRVFDVIRYKILIPPTPFSTLL